MSIREHEVRTKTDRLIAAVEALTEELTSMRSALTDLQTQCDTNAMATSTVAAQVASLKS
jgi:hypothetical protein